MRRVAVFVFAVLFFQFDAVAQNDKGIAAAALIEYKSYGTDLAYGGQFDYLTDRFVFGLSGTFSRYDFTQQTVPYSQSGSARYQDMHFKMRSIHIPVSFRFGAMRFWEAGIVYSFMQTDADYRDIYSLYYNFRYKGKVNMQFSGVQLAYRYITTSGFYFKPELRFVARVSMKEIPDEKTVEIYNPAFAPTEVEDNFIQTYLTFRLAIGYLLRNNK